MPLVKGRYPVTNAVWSVLGQAVNASQSDLPVYSNLSYLGLASVADTAAALTTVKAVGVPVPVDQGATISKITVLVGATAEATGVNVNAALYSGVTVPALQAQSPNLTGAAAVGASAAFTFTLATPVQITPAIAPQGYIYAAVSITATTVPSLAAVSVGAAVDYNWALPGSINSPLGYAFNWAGGGAVAPATIATITPQAAAPLVFLS